MSEAFHERDIFDGVARKVVEARGMDGWNTDDTWIASEIQKAFSDAFRDFVIDNFAHKDGRPIDYAECLSKRKIEAP